MHPPRLPRRVAAVAAALALTALALTGCAAAPEPTAPSASPGATPSSSPAPEPTPREWPTEFNQELHDELVAMLERDQIDTFGGSSGESFQTRTDRLREIIDEFGWPTITLVGKDGEDAAWAIAQHSDLDKEFQRFALERLREAAEAGHASLGNLAYLEDRVLVGEGKPQVWGTQVGCSEDGPVPATPIVDEAGLDDRRAAAGLDPFEDYLAEMAAICAEF